MKTPEQSIAESDANWILRRRPGIITDPIWMEYALQDVDPQVRNQLAAIRLKTVASVYSAIAGGATAAADAIAKQRT
jgi:hypothetical protein